MPHIPAQRGAELVPYRTWEEAGLGPETTVDLGDGTSTSLRELLDDASEDPEHD